jgi:hypothetical protein
MDAWDDRDSGVEAVEFPWGADDDGPACGVAEAATYFLVCFCVQGEMRFIERRCCCYRHIPRPAELLPERAELVEVVIIDARVKSVVGHGQAEITLNTAESAFDPSDPWSWPSAHGSGTIRIPVTAGGSGW